MSDSFSTAWPPGGMLREALEATRHPREKLAVIIMHGALRGS